MVVDPCRKLCDNLGVIIVDLLVFARFGGKVVQFLGVGSTDKFPFVIRKRTGALRVQLRPNYRRSRFGGRVPSMTFRRLYPR